MSLPEDSRLRTHFANLREEDRSAAPPFGRIAFPAAAFRRRGSSLRIALPTMPVLAMAVLLSVRSHRSADAVPRELAAWSSPTAFLLETPGKQLLLFGPLAAQQPPEDPLRDVMFPPEAVMQHQQAVGLSDEPPRCWTRF